MNRKEILELRGVSKYFGGVRAVDDVSLKILERERVSIIGPNGAGKTTLVNLISGYYKPTKGSIVFEGIDITDKDPVKRIELGIVRSFQLANIFSGITVFENIMIPIIARRKLFRKLTRVIDREREVIEEAEEILKIFGLLKYTDMYPHDLSQGDRKLLDAALAFALKPKVLMLDEPTSGVATKDKHVIMDKISEIIDKTGVTCIIVEHDMDIVFKYSERIVVMHQGRVIADSKKEEIKGREDIKSLLLGEIYA